MAIRLRIMTYNVHRCTGLDRKTSTGRIAEVIADFRPDVLALQEIDSGQVRPAATDQAGEIAHRLADAHSLTSPLWVERERCGNVILSRYPLKLVKAGGLRRPRRWPTPARRGVIWVEVATGGVTIQIINTHLGLAPRERLYQARVLTGPEWLQHPACSPPVVLCGDFNARPGSAVHHLIGGLLWDAELCCPPPPKKTWPSIYPVMGLDHLFVSADLAVMSAEAPATALTRLASDHLPLVVDLLLP
jgi:endonuclease/exonuclease/phosphatase family metal-dependent hydrolase